jgi:glutamate-1-semialdehyde 2,1-aminomutase
MEIVTERSEKAMRRAAAVMPGGVSSPVRASRAVGGNPVCPDHGEGARVYDVDGNSYIDYVMAYGPLILGHADPEVVAAVTEAARRGTAFGMTSEPEIELAELVCELVPSIEMVRLTNSGAEATMSAVRLARGHTGRNTIVKFAGNYHGHVDALLVEASDVASDDTEHGTPGSPGVTDGQARDTLTVPYNDIGAVRELFERDGDRVAAVIVEPVAGNMGCVPPAPGFLEELRRLTSRHGSVLIFDEVMTGFRVARGGAQERYGVTPDLTCLGKIIGGGLPVGAVGGRSELMEDLAPAGPVYQAGTLSGNPPAMAAGLAALRATGRPGFYERLEDLGARWRDGMLSAAAQGGVPVTVNQVGSMMSLFFTAGPVTDLATASDVDGRAFTGFFRHLLARGVHLAPSPHEAAFLSAAHTAEDIDLTCAAAREWFTEVSR